MTISLKFSIPGSGILALTGSGEYLPPMAPVDRILVDSLPEPARVVCLPTGAGSEGAERVAYWQKLGEDYFHQLGVSEVRSLPVTDRSGAQDPAMVEAVQHANFVYFSGGKPWYLYDALADTPLWQAALDVLGRGGVVAGCSAGAMIFGEYIPGRQAPLSLSTGFGLLKDTIVMPHFDELPALLRSTLGLLAKERIVVGVEANTAIVLSGDTWRVIGSGGVTLIQNFESIRYTQADFPTK